MERIKQEYDIRCKSWSDIYEHLPTLYQYAKQCDHITECGVRWFVSSYAFCYGLCDQQTNTNNKMLVQVDLERNDTEYNKFVSICDSVGLKTVFYEQSDLDCPLQQTDLLFIDTWHVYGHMKRELERWHSYTNKYIIMHDTTVDEYIGETIRCGFDGPQQSQDTGIPLEEIHKGIWPAIEDFLNSNPQWRLLHRYHNNNGLTILERVL